VRLSCVEVDFEFFGQNRFFLFIFFWKIIFFFSINLFLLLFVTLPSLLMIYKKNLTKKNCFWKKKNFFSKFFGPQKFCFEPSRCFLWFKKIFLHPNRLIYKEGKAPNQQFVSIEIRFFCRLFTISTEAL